MRWRLLSCVILLFSITLGFNDKEAYSSNVDEFWRGYNQSAEAHRAQLENLQRQEMLRQQRLRNQELQLQRDMYMYERGFCPKRGGCSRQYVPCSSPDADIAF